METWIEPTIAGRVAARTALSLVLVAFVAAMFALDIAFLWK